MTDEKCQFCGKIFSINKIDKHINMHIKDSNTPAAEIVGFKYVCKLLNNYSSYTLYGKFCMLKKFVDIPFPTPDIFEQYDGRSKNEYVNLLNNLGYLKVLYYQTMGNNEEELHKKKHLLFNSLNVDDSWLNVINDLWKCVGPDTYTKIIFDDLLKDIKLKLRSE